MHTTSLLALGLLLVSAGAQAAGSAEAAVPAASAPAREFTFSTRHPSRLLAGPIDVNMSKVPANLPYAQLSPAEQAAFKAHYEGMADDEEPPFPLHGLKDVYEPLAQLQTLLSAQGKFDAELLVGHDGEVKEVHVVRSPQRGFTRYATRILMLVRFKPGVCGGQACPSKFPVQVSLQ